MKDFIAYEIALQAARSLGGCLTAIRKKDRDLERQMRRATQSIVLNLAEGDRRRGQDRVHLFRVAAGSAAEVQAALDLAVAWGYLTRGPGRARAAAAGSPAGRLLAAHRAGQAAEGGAEGELGGAGWPPRGWVVTWSSGLGSPPGEIIRLGQPPPPPLLTRSTASPSASVLSSPASSRAKSQQLFHE